VAGVSVQGTPKGRGVSVKATGWWLVYLCKVGLRGGVCLLRLLAGVSVQGTPKGRGVSGWWLVYQCKVRLEEGGSNFPLKEPYSHRFSTQSPNIG